MVPIVMAVTAKKPGTTKAIPDKRKKIVIVGSSFGGRTLVQKLQGLDPNEDYIEILMIDKCAHFEYICSIYKLLVNNDFKKMTMDFKEGNKQFASKYVNFKQAKLTKVIPEKN